MQRTSLPPSGARQTVQTGPSPTRSGSGGASLPASIPDLPIDRIQIRGLDVVGSDSQPIRIDGNGFEIDLTRTAPRQTTVEVHAKNGVACVRASRVATGRVGRNVEVDDDKLGFVASLDLSPQKARVLLRLALLQKRTTKELQRLFDEY